METLFRNRKVTSQQKNPPCPTDQLEFGRDAQQQQRFEFDNATSEALQAMGEKSSINLIWRVAKVRNLQNSI